MSGRASVERKGSSSFLEEVINLAAARLGFTRLTGLKTAHQAAAHEGDRFCLTMGAEGSLDNPGGAALIARGTISRLTSQTGTRFVWTQADLILTAGSRSWHVIAARNPSTGEVELQDPPAQP